MNRNVLWMVLILAALVLAACGSGATGSEGAPTPNPVATVAEAVQQMGQIAGMGPGSGMMGRHHVTVPEPYAGLSNPVENDEASLDRGAEQYSTLCASCHGDGGMGDGPAGASLDPAPAPVAHTSQMLGDDLLFWRISEGGVGEPFSSTMPAWKDSLDEGARWDLINYMRALGQGQVQPQYAAGGAAFDPAVEQAARTEMLDLGVEQGVISPEEAEIFDQVHSAMDDLTATGNTQRLGGMGQMRDALLDALVEAGTITREQADAFNEVHDQLEKAGLME